MVVYLAIRFSETDDIEMHVYASSELAYQALERMKNKYGNEYHYVVAPEQVKESVGAEI